MSQGENYPREKANVKETKQCPCIKDISNQVSKSSGKCKQGYSKTN
jgi:hypothetical protein